MGSDTGIGIAKEDIDEALSEFGQVQNEFAYQHHGTGSGLPLAKMLTEMHDGEFQLESVVDVGTTVSITFTPERTVLHKDCAPSAKPDNGSI